MGRIIGYNGWRQQNVSTATKVGSPFTYPTVQQIHLRKVLNLGAAHALRRTERSRVAVVLERQYLSR
jgi:hypothetical protein